MARGPSVRGGGTPPASRGPSPRARAGGDGAPWLDEAAYEDNSPVHTLIGRRTLLGLLLVAGLLTVGIVVGILLVSKRESAPIDIPAVGEPVPLLTAKGPWKVPPEDEPGTDGIPVEGQGQTLYGTGDGRPTDARIALDALPEDPMPKPGTMDGDTEVIPLPSPAGTRPPAPAAATEKAVEKTPAAQPRPSQPPSTPATPANPVAASMPKVLEALQSGTAPPASAPAKSPSTSAAAASGGQTLQLGAFSSEGRARAAFQQLSGRFSYLAGLEPLILPVASEGRTLYRLRTTAGSAAAAEDICGRLKVAGEACSVVH